MFFIIAITTMLNCANAQIAAPIQKPNSEQSNQNNQNNQNTAVRNIGNTLHEEYTDSDGNLKSKAYRYGFQYKDTFKPAKPSGTTLKESYTSQSGDQGTRNYRYGWQYKSDQEGDDKPLKLTAPKWNAPTPTDTSGDSAGSAAASSSDSTPSSPPPSSPPATALAPSDSDTKNKDVDVFNRMKDLIKERQQLKSGN